MAARAGRAHRTGGQLFGQHLGHLGARAVAGAEKQHVRSCQAGPAGACRNRRGQARVQRGAGADEQLTAARQLEQVVGVAAVGEAAARRDHAAVAQLTQVVGDQVLALPGQLGQLTDAPIAARQLAQQPPAQRVARELQEPRRRRRGGLDRVDHATDNTSI
jgi:hypothetical protein